MNQIVSFHVRVKSITWLATDINSVVLETIDGQNLSVASPGSHIDVKLDSKLTRSYSVVGNAGASNRYEIAVAKDAKSRGGSRFIHESLRVGDELKISEPRNLFALAETATESVLIAGGIGITPIWAMVQRLEELGRPWVLFYAVRSRQHAAYLAEIEALAARSCIGRLLLHFDNENAGAAPDISQVINAASPLAHLYCCGPHPMLAAFEKATSSYKSSLVHLERFTPERAKEERKSFMVRLSKSGREFIVPPEKSILDILLEHSIDAQYGCMQGACGMCEMQVVDGIPDHRDSLLTAEAKATNRCLLICCSRSKTPTLTIDA